MVFEVSSVQSEFFLFPWTSLSSLFWIFAFCFVFFFKFLSVVSPCRHLTAPNGVGRVLTRGLEGTLGISKLSSVGSRSRSPERCPAPPDVTQPVREKEGRELGPEGTSGSHALVC